MRNYSKPGRGIVCACALFLGGCSIPAMRAPERVFTQEMEEKVRGVYQQKFEGLLQPTGTRTPPPEPGRQPAQPTAVQATSQSANVTAGSAEAKAFLKMGMRIADQRCARYFDALGEAVRQFNFGRKELGLLAAFTGAVQGLTGVAAKDLALTAGAFGFGAASLDSFGDAFLFSPDIHAVRGLVQRARDTFEGAMQTDGLDLMDAAKLLRGYESLCTVDGIRSLVNNAVASSRPVAFAVDPPATPTPQPAASATPAPATPAQPAAPAGASQAAPSGASKSVDPSKSPALPQILPNAR